MKILKYIFTITAGGGFLSIFALAALSDTQRFLPEYFWKLVIIAALITLVGFLGAVIAEHFEFKAKSVTYRFKRHHTHNNIINIKTA